MSTTISVEGGGGGEGECDVGDGGSNGNGGGPTAQTPPRTSRCEDGEGCGADGVESGGDDSRGSTALATAGSLTSAILLASLSVVLNGMKAAEEAVATPTRTSVRKLEALVALDIEFSPTAVFFAVFFAASSTSCFLVALALRSPVRPSSFWSRNVFGTWNAPHLSCQAKIPWSCSGMGWGSMGSGNAILVEGQRCSEKREVCDKG